MSILEVGERLDSVAVGEEYHIVDQWVWGTEFDILRWKKYQ